MNLCEIEMIYRKRIDVWIGIALLKEEYKIWICGHILKNGKIEIFMLQNKILKYFHFMYYYYFFYSSLRQHYGKEIKVS